MIVYQPVDQLKLDPANPRRHSKKQVRQIANSIELFGFIVATLTDRYGNVIAGHGRLLAATLHGITEVPTLCLDHLTSAQARAFMIADNRLTENSVWDDRLLAGDHRSRRQALGNNRPLLLGAPPTPPFRPGDDLKSRHRTVSSTSANTVACTSAYQPNTASLCKAAITGRLPSSYGYRGDFAGSDPEGGDQRQ